ncbi:hypothetical protein GGTG_05006 [Gaeumannomyces tritici R3-111a-1]|uniref:YDG domain-containing protein n=1 Tax=Gaeumannomyces tritici (strain R3-111a-1) TaxID=644352 RepID=J3NUQ0_GAET3|nr:hypothetical protein GGTG_05006 [Gaeumannomyces tritici R3-111a-1]EJT79924.1 hypothetical protein GGTG_05006 [Gaeumannomyces tritici R3-111a-1]
MGISNTRKPAQGFTSHACDRPAAMASRAGKAAAEASVRGHTRSHSRLGRRPVATQLPSAIRPPRKVSGSFDGGGTSVIHTMGPQLPSAASPVAVLMAAATGAVTVTATPMDDSPAAMANHEPSPQPARWEHFNDIVAYAPHENSEQAHIEFIKQHRRPCVAQWVLVARRATKKWGTIDPDHPDLREYLIRLKSFIKYLETVDINPRIHDAELKSLHGVINNPDNKFPAFIIEHYNTLEQRWKDMNYGEDEDHIKDSGNESQGEDSGAQDSNLVGRRRGGDVDLARVTVGFPCDEDPVWGLHGVMHGILRTAAPRVQYTPDPRFVHEKRSCHVFGHNGLVPGDWWPLQKVALYRGAHGSSMGGIAGRKGEGAYSIVVGSSQYDDLDRDEGNTIWYSGSHSHENEDPVEHHDSDATKVLLHSLERSDRPVRVLRRKNGNHWAPQFGLRYDGLYRVVNCRTAKNGKGGVYRQFKLERLPVNPARPDLNPCTLEEARDKMPASRQAEIWARVQGGYLPRPGN